MVLEELQREIRRLKEERGVLLCAHYYQDLAVQDVADVVGDSLKLARVAQEHPQRVVVFAAVKFMAETAAIMNPDKSILLPDVGARCPMAAYAPAQKVREAREEHPGVPVVLYVNSVAGAKAEADVTCTSSNAVEVVTRACQEAGSKRVLFGPDANLGRWVAKQTGLEVLPLPPEGHCFVHKLFQVDDVERAMREHPGASLIAHPECDEEVLDRADFVGSTAKLWNHVETTPGSGKVFLVATEVNFVRRAARDFKQHVVLPLVDKARCFSMAKIELSKVLDVLRNVDRAEEWRVVVPPDVAERARAAISKMFQYTS
ncbi:MAG: quinolinate synthase NadA [Promethearchaeota archaeon]